MSERPALVPGLRFSRHESDGGISYVVKNPSSMKYFRFGQIEAWLMQHMDGTRTLQEICEQLRTETGVNAAPAALGVLVRRLREMGLVQRTLEERSALLVERLRQQRRARTDSSSTILRMRFSAGDPDGLLDVMVQRMPFFWTRGFVAASAVAFLAYFAIIVANWSGFVRGTAVFYSPTQMTIGVFLIFYGSFAVTAVIHEFGHGMTCKRHGGEVHEMGAMLLYFMPAFYCNVSDAWTFESKTHRLWVTMAGGWIQLWVAAVAAVVWAFTQPGTLINDIGLYTAVLSGGFSVLLNYNPLIPLDGYYALVDLLEMPNLRARSFAYVGAVLKRHVLRLDAALPEVTKRERRIMLTYGIAAAVYSTMILTVLALITGRFLGAHLGAWGWALFAVMLMLILRRARTTVTSLAREVLARKLPPGRRARFAVIAAVATLVVGTAAAATPWTVHATGRATIEPVQRGWLRAPAAARLAAVPALEGTRVEAGAVVAVLEDAALEVERAQLLALVEELESRAAAALSLRDQAAARAARLDAEAARHRLRIIDQLRERLVLRAPSAGVIVTPRLEERIGEGFSAGDSIIELWLGTDLRVRVDIDQHLAAGVEEGAGLRIRFPGDGARTWHTRILRIEPATTDHAVIAWAALPAEAAAALRPGMQGRARVVAERTSIAGAMARTWRRTIRSDLFL